MSKKGDPQVEKDIPIPKMRWSKYRDVVARMGVNDSVVVPTFRDAQKLRMTIARDLGLKATSRKLKDGSYRIWVTDELLKSTEKEDMNVTT